MIFQLYPSEDWLVQSSLPSKFFPSAIKATLDELSPETVRIFWESKSFEGCTDLVEPWYGTKYSVQKLPPSTIQQWIEKAPKEDLHLPIPNIFIATDLTIKQVSDKVPYPYLIRKSPFSRLWYKPDTMFFTPKAYIKIEFNCPLSNQSPEAAVLTDMLTRLLMDYLNEYAYYAAVAGLYYSIHSSNYGFQGESSRGANRTQGEQIARPTSRWKSPRLVVKLFYLLVRVFLHLLPLHHKKTPSKPLLPPPPLGSPPPATPTAPAGHLAGNFPHPSNPSLRKFQI
ncbi:Zinc-metallopeptidase, peroxisomal [Dendrobium catenatum]|uniref:Zinc-metallopeptidase, peroxisomal n=1 Tax=Dendrobium catenatum TaxID=906689 RepID=A0A2I0W968_9ASPA|nr:Zinc-metallopeptidase, peroxisomal [Dendrobium catenatum]